MFLLAVIATAFTVMLSGCGKTQESTEPATHETTQIETLETVNDAEVNYGAWNNEVSDTLEKLYNDNREIFKRTAELMLSQENDLIVSYDFSESVLQPVLSDGKGGNPDINEVFSKDEQDLIMKCFKIMYDASPKYTHSFRIDRDAGNMAYEVGINFMYRTKLNIDVGILYSEKTYLGSDFKRLDDNFYTFWYGLV